jgi:hypothetical protein
MGRFFKDGGEAQRFSRALHDRGIRNLPMPERGPNAQGLYGVISPDLPLQVPDRTFNSADEALEALGIR